MVSEGQGRLFKRKDGKYLVYLPKDLCEDSQFPFKDFFGKSPRTEEEANSVRVKVSFKINDPEPKLLVELQKEN